MNIYIKTLAFLKICSIIDSKEEERQQTTLSASRIYAFSTGVL
jgi:hypothetical protein